METMMNSMSTERNGRFMSPTGNTKATENVKRNGQLISKTICHVNCEVFIPKSSRIIGVGSVEHINTNVYHWFNQKQQ